MRCWISRVDACCLLAVRCTMQGARAFASWSSVFGRRDGGAPAPGSSVLLAFPHRLHLHVPHRPRFSWSLVFFFIYFFKIFYLEFWSGKDDQEYDGVSRGCIGTPARCCEEVRCSSNSNSSSSEPGCRRRRGARFMDFRLAAAATSD